MLAVSGCAVRPPAAASPSASVTAGAVPTGSVTIAGLLSIRGARLEPGPGGTEELVMTVTDEGGGPEHLYEVLTSNSARAELENPRQAPISGEGVELDPNTPVAFGPGGARILLIKPAGLHVGKPVMLSLVFADAGLAHLAVVPDALASPSMSAATPSAAGWG